MGNEYVFRCIYKYTYIYIYVYIYVYIYKHAEPILKLRSYVRR